MYTPEENGFFKDYPGHNRFDMPRDIVRVTAGLGGDSLLIMGSEKVALYDCGMACFSDKLISNLHEVLDPLGRTIDYIVLSHTHYDHIGALPYVLKEFPDAKVYASEKAEKVFNSETARNTMEDLGEKARILYVVDGIRITASGMRVDKILSDEEEIELGDKKIIAYLTPGHTLCSTTYGIIYDAAGLEKLYNKSDISCEEKVAGEVTKKTFKKPSDVLLMSESVGTYDGNKVIEPSALKSYGMTIDVAKRLKALNYPILIGMHYGVIEPVFVPDYFDTYIKYATEERDFFVAELKSGKSDDEIFQDHKALWWNDERELNQPFGAYSTNTYATIRRLRAKLEM